MSRIAIVQHVEHEPPGLLGEIWHQAGVLVDIVRLDQGHSLPSLDDCQALIVMGGPMNVYQEREYPFLTAEDAFIKEALSREVPYLGICLGAQLLAKALGAPVTPNRVKEVGFHYVKLTAGGAQDPLFQGCGGGLEVFQWHQDTFAIPEGAVRLATSEMCANQAFRYGRAAYGLQFHVEVTPEMLELWREDLRAESASSYEGGLVAPADWPQAAELLKGQWSAVLRNFVKVVSAAGPAKGVPL